MLPGPRDLRRAWSRSPPRPAPTCSLDEVYRGLEVDLGGPAAGRRRRAADAASRSASCRSRSPWPGCGSAGWRRHDRDAARPRRGVQGLHDDLLVRAVRDPRDHRAAGSRPGARPVARASSSATSPTSTGSSSAGPTPSPGSGRGPARSAIPRLTAPGVGSRRLGGPPRRDGGRAAPAGLAVRATRQPLPDRVRARGPARGAWRAWRRFAATTLR